MQRLLASLFAASCFCSAAQAAQEGRARPRTHPPATLDTGNFYGGQWWLVPDDRQDVPRDAYSTAGNRGQFVIVAPSHDLVIVRRGLDYGGQGFDRWALFQEVIKAFPAE